MARWVTSRSKPHTGPHMPAKKETLARLREFIAQAWHHIRNAGPAPDVELLFHGEPTHFVSLETVMIAGHPAVAIKFNGRKLDFGLRHVRPEGLAVLRGLTLYGGGLAVNKNNSGPRARSYVRYGRPYVQIVRFLLDTERGQTVRQNGQDFRSVIAGGSFEQAPGTRRPRKGRMHAVDFALSRYRCAHRKSDLGLSVTEYDALLWELFELLDAADQARAQRDASA